MVVCRLPNQDMGEALMSPEVRYLHHHNDTNGLKSYSRGCCAPPNCAVHSEWWHRCGSWGALKPTPTPTPTPTPNPDSPPPVLAHQLKGHQSSVGHEESSEEVHRPQWQFSIRYDWGIGH